ncbi:hypothetical protein H072_724 [Dactylellina haptotyla CBS 200.50]|uniref:Uncharacterized protein n=1 Tax=Dactylellina haptotyla (strain CBS 200.50) TaxID=1284197 RepID=S8AQP5_DACHA|nr:hypothetical protein H072_724 [Dactylellina haptotyla CBS 200.50]
MAPTTNTTTTTTTAAAKSGPGRKKKPTTPTEPTRRSTRTITPRTIFSTGVTKPKAAPKKRKTTVADKVVGVAKKVKGTLTKKPAVKAAGTKKIKGTDGKGVKKTKAKAV